MPDRDAEIARRLRAVITPASAPDGDGVQRRFALLVGIDHYRDPALSLSYCASDVRALERTLSSRGYEVTVLTDARATRDVVLAELQKVVGRADGDDLVLVHFSCHGQLVGGRPHLLLHDTPRGEEAIVAKGLRLTDVLATLHQGRSRWTAILLDACHMGLGLDPETAASTPRFQDMLGGFALLAGSTEGQITQDSEKKRSGVFTAALLEGLRGAAAGPSGGVQFSALAHHVQRRVAAWRRSAEGVAKLAAQTPVVRMEVADVPLLSGLEVTEIDPGHVPRLFGLVSGESSAIRSSAFSPDGRWVATASEDYLVRLWDAETGKPHGDGFVHENMVVGVAFVHGEPLLASLTTSGWLRFWRPEETEPLEPPKQTSETVTAFAFSPAGPRFAVAAIDRLHVYEGRRQTEPSWENTGEGILFTSVAFSPDGRRLVTSGEEKKIRLWDAETGAKLRVIQIGGPVAGVAFSADGKRIATVGGDLEENPRLRNVPSVWDAETGKRVFATDGHTQVGRSAAFSGDGRWLATTSFDGTVRLWHADDGRPAMVLGVANESQSVTFSPDSRRLFVGLASGRGLIYRLPEHP